MFFITISLFISARLICPCFHLLSISGVKLLHIHLQTPSMNPAEHMCTLNWPNLFFKTTELFSYLTVFWFLTSLSALFSELSKAQRLFAKDMMEFKFECIGNQLTDDEAFICKCCFYFQPVLVLTIGFLYGALILW